VIRQYARLYPQSTIALVLVDGVVAKSENAANYSALAGSFSGPNGHQAREKFIRAMLTPAAAGFEPEVLKVTMNTPDANASGAMMAMADPAIWKEDSFSGPVLGIYADHSRLANRELLKQVFPAIEYVEIPGTDHFLMMEKPAEFNRLLLPFLAKQK
jgi:pimeloyl-ACP methyl ester carboxylesterase